MVETFDMCVDILVWIANVFGITYKEANIWIFVIIEPVLFLLMGALIICQRDRINKLKQLRGSIEE
jgi:hypothetical protein